MSIRMTRSVTCSPIQNPSCDTSIAFGWPSGVLNSLAIVAFRTGGGGAAGFAPRTSPGASGRPRWPKRHAARRNADTSADRKALRYGHRVWCASCRNARAIVNSSARHAIERMARRLLLQSGMKRTLFSVALVGIGVAALGGFENGDGVPQPPAEEWARRNDALARARIFRDEPFDAASIDFAADPNRGVVDPDFTSCPYKPDEVSGTTPKFDCELPSGEKIKVKYGWTHEIPSEVAATRLLHALGFGADRVSRVETVRCYGCPFQPFHSRALLEMLNLDAYFDKRIDYSAHRDFTRVSVERNLDGEAIEAGDERGWAFHELDRIDPSRGGATRAEVDALRLMAIFLHHWDNKSSNQRLTCEARRHRTARIRSR